MARGMHATVRISADGRKRTLYDASRQRVSTSGAYNVREVTAASVRGDARTLSSRGARTWHAGASHHRPALRESDRILLAVGPPPWADGGGQVGEAITHPTGPRARPTDTRIATVRRPLLCGKCPQGRRGADARRDASTPPATTPTRLGSPRYETAVATAILPPDRRAGRGRETPYAFPRPSRSWLPGSTPDRDGADRKGRRHRSNDGPRVSVWGLSRGSTRRRRAHPRGRVVDAPRSGRGAVDRPEEVTGLCGSRG